MTKEDILAEQ